MKLNKILCAAALVVTAGTAQAATLYGTVGQGGTASTLHMVDPLTGTTTLIGDVGYTVSGLDFYDGVLYGVTARGDPNYHGLITIDTTTGAGTEVGAGWGASLIDQTAAGLAISSSGAAYSWSEPGVDDLTGVDLSSGLLTGVVGDAGLSTYTLGMAFSASGDLIFFNGDEAVYEIDTTTGAATELAEIDSFAHHGDFDPDSGLYWGLGTSAEETDATLVSFDLDTLSLSLPIDLDVDLHTLAFRDGATVPDPVDPPVSPVPVPAGLPLLALGLGGLAMVRRRS